MNTVFIIGHFPPPIGGISVHVDREMNILEAKGYSVFGFDLSSVQKKEQRRIVYSGNKLKVLCCYLWMLLRIRPDIVHVHISAGRNIVSVLLLILCARLFSKTVITIHSGSFPLYIKRIYGFSLVYFRGVFNLVDVCVGVSSEIVTAVEELFPKARCKKVIIPAYLSIKREMLPKSKDRDVLMASGYATKTYDWFCLLDALEKVTDLKEVIFVFYHEYDPGYYHEIQRRIVEMKQLNIVVYNDLSQEAFQKLMDNSGVLVRPTINDGDSVAVREALAGGTIVIASDAVIRPKGVVIHKTGDSESLYLCISHRRDYEIPEGTADFSAPLLQVFNELIDPK